jgi:uncharacterized protein (TIGR02466 family)
MAKTDQLNSSLYFSTPIYSIEIPEWVSHVDKVCDKYIKAAKDNNKKAIKEREKTLGKKIGDHGMSHHSTSLVGDPDLKELQEYIGATSWNILDHMGYDLTNYEIFWTEFWVQQFAEKGAGNHSPHVHHNNHISGFYFLRCSDKTSFPLFHDPRPAKLITQLPVKNESDITLGTDKIHYRPKPGTMIFIPAYLMHEYVVDNGIQDFRFIHFNLQAVPKMITNVVREQTKETIKENIKEKK